MKILEIPSPDRGSPDDTIRNGTDFEKGRERSNYATRTPAERICTTARRENRNDGEATAYAKNVSQSLALSVATAAMRNKMSAHHIRESQEQLFT